MAQDYLRHQNRALLAKAEAVEDTFETLAGATDAIPIEDLELTLNPVVRENNEATDSIDTGERDIARVEPKIGGAIRLRGSGAPATAPRTSPIIRCIGHTLTAATVIPVTGTTAATAGTTSSFSIDTAVATDWSTVTGSYVGRVVELSVNPAVTTRRHIKSYVVTTGTAVVTLDGPVFGAALSTATLAKILPCQFYTPTAGITAPVSISLEHYLDGYRTRLRGARGTGTLTFPAADIPKITGLEIDANFEGDADATPSGVDFTTLPPAPIWEDGIFYLDQIAFAATQLTLNLQNTKTRHPNPNLNPGIDATKITKRDLGGEIQLNMAYKATHDRVGKLRGNTAMALSAMFDMNKAAGRRMALYIPTLKLLDRRIGDREGIADDTLPYQILGAAYYLSMCL